MNDDDEDEFEDDVADCGLDPNVFWAKGITIGPLTLLKRMYCGGTFSDMWLIVGWHPSASITWRWALRWGPYRPYNDSFVFMKKNGGATAIARLPFIGNWEFDTQEFMLDRGKVFERNMR